MKIPFLNLKRLHDSIKPELDEAISRVFESQQFILGKEVGEFEKAVSGYLGVSYAVGVASGTDALLLSLEALAYKIYGEPHFKPGDEIITTPFTFVATADTILLAGARPVFVDIDPATFNINPREIQKYLERFGKEAPQVKAILVVHLYGQAADLDEFLKISQEYNIPIIEDVAQAIGAKWQGKYLGSLGAAGCLSFFPSKPLGAFGDGGMIVTSDKDIFERASMLRTHGGKDKYDVSILGHNSRLDSLQAAILLAKLKHVEKWTEGRQKVAEIYSHGLAGIDDLVLPKYSGTGSHIWHQYTLRTGRRDDLKAFLKERGIETSIYYPIPLHKQKLFGDKANVFGMLSNSEKVSEEVLSLPIDPLQTEKETRFVVNTIKEFFDNKSSQ